MKQPLHIAGMIVAGVACMMLVIAIGTTAWMTRPGIFNYGIFRACNRHACATISPTGTEVAVRFFEVCGFLFSLTAVVVSIFYFVKFVSKDVQNKMLPFVASMELIVAGVAAIIGAIIFAVKVKPDFEKATRMSMDIGFSFGLAIVGSLFSIGAGVLIFVQRGRSDSQ